MQRDKIFEEFLQCKGDWGKSSLMMSVESSTTNRRRGVYKWFTRQACVQHSTCRTAHCICRHTLCSFNVDWQGLLKKYDNDEEVVNEIIASKDT